MVGRIRATLAAPVLMGCFMQVPALRDEHINVCGFYVGADILDPLKKWTGFALYESYDANSGYLKRQEYSSRCVTGVLKSLPQTSSIVDYRLIDRVSTIDVELTNPNRELSSVTESEMLAGRNRFLFGEEILGAATIALLSVDTFSGKRTYRFSNLLRGIKDTFTKMDGHFEEEPVVWLDGPGIYFFQHAASAIGQTVYYKLVAGGGNLSESIIYSVDLKGETLAPFRPVGILASRDGSNNLTVTWLQQTRKSVQVLQQGQPFQEEAQSWKVYVISNSDPTIALRATTVTSPTFTYSAANQTTDGLTPGNPVKLQIIPLSSTILDAGHTSEVTV